MHPRLSSALIQGYESLAAWSDLLDRINVFPVSDGDTGRNLRISLAPLRGLREQPAAVPHEILRNATGNAGNIAAAFFFELLSIENVATLSRAVSSGVQRAFAAVVDPKPGTMLTLLEVLDRELAAVHLAEPWPVEALLTAMEQSVAETSEILPQMRQAGVVDAGALGMFIFLESFLGSLSGQADHHRPVTRRFEGKLEILKRHTIDETGQYCVSAVIRPDGDPAEVRRQLLQWGHSIVINQDADHLKVHLHAADRDALQTGLAHIGRIVHWSEEKIKQEPLVNGAVDQPVHIMTDAAGSVTLEDARQLGMTLLDSYLVVGDRACPETLFEPAALYAAMAGGQKVSTAQASIYQRHQSYLSAVSRFDRVLYLCVGSVYTGNFETAAAWRTTHEDGCRMILIDTGAASGRLGIAALVTARYARRGHGLDAVIRFAQDAVALSRELVFLDRLKYLAAGGRISRTKGFFGDLLHKKPIITPTAHGAARIGVVRTREDQLDFALKHLEDDLETDVPPLILLQYSDNRIWVEETAAVRIKTAFPSADIMLRPLSLTSGAHMGPGTWAVASLPGTFNV